MTIFYLGIDEKIYALDSTEEVTKNLKGSLSSSLVEDGNFSSDNYVNNPVTFSFNGIISDIKTLDNDFQKTTKEYLDQINKAFVDKLSIKVYYSNIQFAEDSCYFTSFSHTQNNVHGKSISGNSFEVSFTLQKVRYGQQAQIVSKPSAAISKSVQEKQEKNSTTKKPNESVNDAIVAGARTKAEGQALLERGLNGS